MSEKDRLEIYPMKQSPDHWAWRVWLDGKIICKSPPIYPSEDEAQTAFNYARMTMALIYV